MMRGESLSEILDSVKMTMKMPIGDMDEKMAMREAVITMLPVFSNNSIPVVMFFADHFFDGRR